MIKKITTSNLKLGIISGGQLGKMLIQEASKWDIECLVMDNDTDCPAGKIASHFIHGSNTNFEAVYNFGKRVDLLTFEIENINIEALKKLKNEGINIAPDPLILELIQDKGLQKIFYQENDIATSPFHLYENKEAVINAIENGEITFPFVQKLRSGGYDGRGVSVINNKEELNKLLTGSSLVENKVEIQKEIAVIVARNEKGEIKHYPVVEMLFDSKANLVDKLICPSYISKEQENKAIHYAHKIIDLLNMNGLLAVEFFVDNKGEIVVNEMAPRTHNSGHHTIESIVTSQFEQHLRAILNLPLGSTEIRQPAVMINILGGEGFQGPVIYEGLEECLALEGVKIHLYGKKITKPFRKMGHATILSDTRENAIKKAETVQQLLKVKA